MRIFFFFFRTIFENTYPIQREPSHFVFSSGRRRPHLTSNTGIGTVQIYRRSGRVIMNYLIFAPAIPSGTAAAFYLEQQARRRPGPE